MESISNAITKIQSHPTLTKNLSRAFMVAVLVMVVVSATNMATPTTCGWLMFTLAAASFLLNLASGKLKERKVELIIHGIIMLAIMTIGIVGARGYLTSQMIGQNTAFAFFLYLPAYAFVLWLFPEKREEYLPAFCNKMPG